MPADVGACKHLKQNARGFPRNHYDTQIMCLSVQLQWVQELMPRA